MTTTIARARRLTSTALLATCLHLTACDPWAAQPVLDKLDGVTGQTAIVLQQPVVLVAESSRGAERDPFAFLAPFETDRMGSRELYLWVSAPQDRGPVQHLEVLCDDQVLALERLDARPAGLSRSPYPAPAPWSGQWYFSLPESALQCFASARGAAVVTRLAGDVEDRFVSKPGAMRALAAFAAHHANPLQ